MCVFYVLVLCTLGYILLHGMSNDVLFKFDDDDDENHFTKYFTHKLVDICV